MGDDRPCHMEGIGTILVKMFDGMVRELKDVSYVPQLKRNFYLGLCLQKYWVLKYLLEMEFSR